MKSFVVHLALALACSPGCDEQHKSDGRAAHVSTAGDVQRIETELGLQFPAGTKLIGYHREHGMDDYLGLKVEMPRAALQGFLASTPIAEEQYAYGEGGLLGADGRGYWDPHRQPKLRTGQARLPGARVEHRLRRFAFGHRSRVRRDARDLSCRRSTTALALALVTSANDLSENLRARVRRRDAFAVWRTGYPMTPDRRTNAGRTARRP